MPPCPLQHTIRRYPRHARRISLQHVPSASYLHNGLVYTRLRLAGADNTNTAVGQSPGSRAYHSSRKSSGWAAVASVATNVVSNVAKRAVNGPSDLPNHPLKLLAKELGTKFLTPSIAKLVSSSTPQLDRVAKYYTQSEGKYVRPRIVLLMSRATSLCPKASPASTDPPRTAASIDHPISPASILSNVSDSSSPARPTSSILTFQPPQETLPGVNPAQRRLAEITETIHTASLLHDDVIDHSEARRGAPSANLQFGNKMAVLGGDFLLARASVALARLRHPEVVELLATVIANLVEGEFMQLKNTALDEANPVWTEDALTYYLEKTYLKTASLISKSCRATAILGDVDAATVEAAYLYGKNLGLAFQLVDDMLDYTRSGTDLGKPAGADLELGLATAPLLFAWKGNPELGALVGRKFSAEGDVNLARELVLKSNGIEQTRALAESYANQAAAAIEAFPDSEAKEGLLQMTRDVLKRKK
ncbi:related to Probable hexaprenyl pyrophosphate synthase, mitochondrial [Cephalotrichum gorgonifer]|uniref:Related to Probable hexaprenyl pyrophosphate synthase, mitochondrial n=1 Tax=Cephalotrichum gorgonifer TaxID=2041049 RepID=A0AAE8N8X3_9PEZI|nr:related to Probable hexaprenyl pyrophosphate synthase, mitochondrial [Cephalotrichum gorgonifer]